MIFLHELGHYSDRQVVGDEGHRVLHRLRPEDLVVPAGRDRVRRQGILPGGAYVRIIGMNNLDEVDPADEPRTYRQQSFPKRLLVVSPARCRTCCRRS